MRPAMPLPSVPALPALARAYEAPLLALALSLALVFAGRMRRTAWATGGAAGTGALLGWGLRLGGPRPWSALIAPASTAQHLLLVAAVALGAGLLGARLRGAWPGRWLAVAVAILVGWWVARSPAAGAQFWRAWVVCAALVAPLLRAGDAGRLAAAPLALGAGLLAAGASAPWQDIGFVVAAAALPLLAAQGVAPLPVALLGAATATAASLGAGRLARGGIGSVDLACALALAAPWLVAPAARRLGRAAPAAPIAVAVVAGALAWVGRLALAHHWGSVAMLQRAGAVLT